MSRRFHEELERLRQEHPEDFISVNLDQAQIVGAPAASLLGFFRTLAGPGEWFSASIGFVEKRTKLKRGRQDSLIDALIDAGMLERDGKTCPRKFRVI